ncbi:hypothetical protein DW103_07645 [Parabacteroides sp. AM08-6]|nr:hypothetical protein DW103_07645 [Parabacteroides sp. AM08-6]
MLIQRNNNRSIYTNKLDKKGNFTLKKGNFIVQSLPRSEKQPLSGIFIQLQEICLPTIGEFGIFVTN